MHVAMYVKRKTKITVCLCPWAPYICVWHCGLVAPRVPLVAAAGFITGNAALSVSLMQISLVT